MQVAMRQYYIADPGRPQSLDRHRDGHPYLRLFNAVPQRRGKHNSHVVAEAQSDEQVVPDEVLVALAALDHAFPEWLRSDSALIWPHITASNDPEWRLADRIRTNHETLFGSFEVLKFRKRFLQMSDGVEVH